jgi:hypothetical protein
MKRLEAPIQRSAALVALLFTIIMITLAGCQFRSPPPQPSEVTGLLGETTYTFLQWKEGLNVMIWDDVKGARSSSTVDSVDGPIFQHEASAESLDGRLFGYRLETSDGKTAVFAIDDREYDLAKGTLFLVTTRGGRTSVQQLVRDLASVLPTQEGCEEFGRTDPVVATFVKANE